MSTIKLNPELAKTYGVETIEEYGDLLILIVNQTIRQNSRNGRSIIGRGS